MSIPNWLADVSANKFTRTYMKDYLDLSGNLYLRNSSIITPMNTITFNDTTGYVNFGNVYVNGNLFIYNPTTTSNVDIIGYVNTNNSNITSINSSITTANSNISTNTSNITTLTNKIGTLNYDNVYDFTTCNNLFINPGGVLQYEDAYGNHPDLIGSVITNTSDIGTLKTQMTTANTNITTANTNITTLQTQMTTANTNITTANTNIATANTAISTLQTKTSAQGYNSTTGTTQFAGIVNCNVVSFINSINNVSTTTFGYISGLTSSAQTQLDSKCSLTTNQTLSGQKTFSATPLFTANLLLNGSLLLNNNTLTITNATLQKLQYLDVTSSIQTQINTINSNSVSLANANTFTNSNTFQAVTFNGAISAQLGGTINGTLNTNTLTCASLNNISQNTIAFLDATSSIQTQLNNKGGLATTNYWTNGNNFNGQLTGAYNAGSALVGSPTEFFFTGQRSWANGTPANGDNVYELSFDTGYFSRGMTIQGGTKNTLSGTGMKSIFGLYYRQYINGGTDPTRIPIMYGEDSETGAINNTLVIPSSLRLDGGLILNSGALTLTNANLQKLQYCSTISSDIQTQVTGHTTSISTLNTKTTDISWASGSPNTTTIANKLVSSILSFGTSINGISTTTFNYISGLTSDLATTLSSLSSSITTINSKLPVGMIITHPKNNLASPYLLCNGQLVSRTTYSALFTSIGTTYSAGDGSTTFGVPNFQACFLRGAGTQTIGSTSYTSASVGTAQNDSIIGHQHSGQSGQFLSTSTSSASVNGYASLAVVKPTTSNFGNTGGVVSGGGSETAPAHHCIYYYILAL